MHIDSNKSARKPTPENWFTQGGRAYASYRPKYPPQLSDFLASLVSTKNIVVDVGCGSGQLTALLAQHFKQVFAFDPSVEQIRYAEPGANISYQCALAESLPLASGCANLITVAQAAHWFDLPAFYNEVNRIATSNAVLALISYGVLSLEPDLDDCFQDFYHNDIYSFWPAARRLVDSGYADLDFPFIEQQAPVLSINLRWDLREFLGYVSTWSAIRHAEKLGQLDVLSKFASNLYSIWGAPEQKRTISWPINMRIGSICK